MEKRRNIKLLQENWPPKNKVTLLHKTTIQGEQSDIHKDENNRGQYQEYLYRKRGHLHPSASFLWDLLWNKWATFFYASWYTSMSSSNQLLINPKIYHFSNEFIRLQHRSTKMWCWHKLMSKTLFVCMQVNETSL